MTSIILSGFYDPFKSALGTLLSAFAEDHGLARGAPFELLLGQDTRKGFSRSMEPIQVLHFYSL
jgi:hypothetical protein